MISNFLKISQKTKFAAACSLKNNTTDQNFWSSTRSKFDVGIQNLCENERFSLLSLFVGQRNFC